MKKQEMVEAYTLATWNIEFDWASSVISEEKEIQYGETILVITVDQNKLIKLDTDLLYNYLEELDSADILNMATASEEIDPDHTDYIKNSTEVINEKIHEYYLGNESEVMWEWECMKDYRMDWEWDGLEVRFTGKYTGVKESDISLVIDKMREASLAFIEWRDMEKWHVADELFTYGAIDEGLTEEELDEHYRMMDEEYENANIEVMWIK